MWKKIQERLNSPDSFISMILGLAVVLVLGITLFNAIKSFTTAKKQAEEQKKQEEAAKEATKLPLTYTVKLGDNLWEISIVHYKTGYNWTDIATENKLDNPDLIYPDQKLTIPDVKPRIVEEGQISADSVVRAKHTSYTVVDGDCLWDIAGKEYENNMMWGSIAEKNAIPNPDLIYAGTILQLP